MPPYLSELTKLFSSNNIILMIGDRFASHAGLPSQTQMGEILRILNLTVIWAVIISINGVQKPQQGISSSGSSNWVIQFHCNIPRFAWLHRYFQDSYGY
jgi:hypothetical protein